MSLVEKSVRLLSGKGTRSEWPVTDRPLCPEVHVPRFGLRTIPHALAAIAAIILALAGGLAATVHAHAASSLSLVILPDQGENAIYNFVNSATSSINVTIYEFKDTTLVNDLVAREKAGVKVRV